MGLFGSGIVKLTDADVEKAVDRIANYYRQTRLYLSLCNSSDAYDYFVREHTEDIRLMVSIGFCYKYKGNYLTATDLDNFFDDYPEQAMHFYGCVPGMLAYVKREIKDVLFINSIGPSGSSMDLNTYKLIRDFVNMYKKDYVIISDCTAGIDLETDTFEKQTGCRKININSNTFYRWN